MTKPQVLIVQHVPWEKPGRILDSLDDMELPYQIVNIAGTKKPDLPNFNGLAGVVVMGGPMGAQDFDKYPGLKAEAKLVRAAIAVNKPVLGHLSGASDHRHGARRQTQTRVRNPENRIRTQSNASTNNDYFSMWNKTIDVLHWHNVRGIAARRRAAARTFRQHQEPGLQIRFRARPAIPSGSHPTLLEEWLDEPSMVKELKAAGGSKSKLREDFAAYDPQLQPLADQVFSGFAARCNSYAHSLAR